MRGLVEEAPLIERTVAVVEVCVEGGGCYVPLLLSGRRGEWETVGGGREESWHELVLMRVVEHILEGHSKEMAGYDYEQPPAEEWRNQLEELQEELWAIQPWRSQDEALRELTEEMGIDLAGMTVEIKVLDWQGKTMRQLNSGKRELVLHSLPFSVRLVCEKLPQVRLSVEHQDYLWLEAEWWTIKDLATFIEQLEEKRLRVAVVDSAKKIYRPVLTDEVEGEAEGLSISAITAQALLSWALMRVT